MMWFYISRSCQQLTMRVQLGSDKMREAPMHHSVLQVFLYRVLVSLQLCMYSVIVSLQVCMYSVILTMKMCMYSV
jgi:hypothetical protein